jgi:hypothetical protein
LSGGTSAWAASGRVLSTERTPESAMAKDVWIEAYDHEDPADREREMKRYLEWEVNLVRQLEHEPSASFEIR